MTLDYPSPAAVAAGVRLRLEAHTPDIPILIVEGKTDRATLISALRPEVVVIWATNKEKSLGARAHLTERELERCAFVVDCDGDLAAPWRHSDEVIISDQRDLDADAALGLGALKAVVRDHFAAQHLTGLELEKSTHQIAEFVTRTTAMCGAVTDVARSLDTPVRVEVRSSRGVVRKRRVRADDLAEFPSWVGELRNPALHTDILPAVSRRLGWSVDTESRVDAACRAAAEKRCRNHSRARCIVCATRTFANGHDLTAVLDGVLALKLGAAPGERELARQLRLAIDRRYLGEWRVMRRLAERGAATGRPYVVGSN